VTTRSIESWVMLLERSFGAVMVSVPCLVMTGFAALSFFHADVGAKALASGEDHGADIGRALGLNPAEKIETSTMDTAFRARFPDGTPSTVLDRFFTELHGTCSVAEAPPNATIYRCQLPVSASFCIRRDLWTSANLASNGTITGIKAAVGTSSC
jgi:hypothetical protein